MQTGEFLGRKLAKRLKSISQEGTEADVALAGARKEAEEGGDNIEVLRHERRKVEDRLDLEVLDDRDLYQHLLKVYVMEGTIACSECLTYLVLLLVLPAHLLASRSCYG